jgi:predicted ester cyclase
MIAMPKKARIMYVSANDLSARYRAYIDCLNRQDWAALGLFVHEAAEHNDRTLGLAGYREMLEADFRAIPDLWFEIRLLLSQPPFVASRLHFDCTPAGVLFGLPVNGRRVRFDENVFYAFEEGKIRRVWSVIDTAAIAAQI